MALGTLMGLKCPVLTGRVKVTQVGQEPQWAPGLGHIVGLSIEDSGSKHYCMDG